MLEDLTQNLSILSKPHFTSWTIHMVPDRSILFQNKRDNWTYMLTIDILIDFLSMTVKSNFWNGIFFCMSMGFGTSYFKLIFIFFIRRPFTFRMFKHKLIWNLFNFNLRVIVVVTANKTIFHHIKHFKIIWNFGILFTTNKLVQELMIMDTLFLSRILKHFTIYIY